MTEPALLSPTPDQIDQLNEQAVREAHLELSFRKPALEALLADDPAALERLRVASWSLRVAYIQAVKEALVHNGASVQQARVEISAAAAEIRRGAEDLQSAQELLNTAVKAAELAAKLIALSI